MARSQREPRLSFDRDTVRLRGESVHWSWRDSMVWARERSVRAEETDVVIDWRENCRFRNDEQRVRQQEYQENSYWCPPHFGPDHSLEQEEAEGRAKTLLLECLSSDQRKEYSLFQSFTVTSPSGRRYKIGNWKNYNVKSEDFAYCAGPRDEVPIADMMLVQKLMLENDEETFLELANKQGKILSEDEVADIRGV